MSRVVELGDKLVFDTSKGGFKVAPDKCEFLDNLIIKNIECEVAYPLDVVKDTIGEGSNLEDWMTSPDDNRGVEFIFECNLYGKDITIILTSPDHACYDEPLTTNWIDALNIIVSSVTYFDADIDLTYLKLTELGYRTIEEYIKSEDALDTIIVTRDRVVLEPYKQCKEIIL